MTLGDSGYFARPPEVLQEGFSGYTESHDISGELPNDILHYNKEPRTYRISSAYPTFSGHCSTQDREEKLMDHWPDVWHIVQQSPEAFKPGKQVREFNQIP